MASLIVKICLVFIIVVVAITLLVAVTNAFDVSPMAHVQSSYADSVIEFIKSIAKF